MNDKPLELATPYGQAQVIGYTKEGGLWLNLPKANMPKDKDGKVIHPHPNFRGGPCVLWIQKPTE